MASRINKYLSEVGFCSRRAADILIEEGKVTINGEITEIGSKVEEGDQVEVEGQKIINPSFSSIDFKSRLFTFRKAIKTVTAIFKAYAGSLSLSIPNIQLHKF